jgi:hypothetical protein
VRSPLDYFDKSSTAPTPLPLKVGVIAYGWVLAAPLLRTLAHPPPGAWPSFLVGALTLATLVAIWNLRRWGVLGFVVVSLATMVLSVAMGTAPAGLSWRLHALVLGLRLLVLVPALWAWPRMTW